MDSFAIRAHTGRRIIYGLVWAFSAAILFLVIRPVVNRIAAPYHLSGIDDEVIGAAFGAVVAITATGIIEGFLILAAGAPSRVHVRKMVMRMRQWLFSLNAHWGPRRSSAQRTLANTAEGLIATIRSNDTSVSPVEQQIVSSAVDFIVQQGSADGLPSVSLAIRTVHRTAMGLFALSLAVRAGRYDVSRRVRAVIGLLARSLKRSSTKFGWGFENSSIAGPPDCRVFSSLWALRALNYTSGAEDWYLEQFTILLRYVPSGRFGFTYDDQPRTSMMALFLIVLGELENPTLRQILVGDLDIEAIVTEVLRDVRAGIWHETEEYAVPRGRINAEKLAWSHVTVALAIDALSIWRARLRPIDRYHLDKIVRRVVRHHISPMGVFRERQMTQDNQDPFMYPTSYVITALQRWTAA